eukprot:10489833-Heterocapsa_arctica.AAC.1
MARTIPSGRVPAGTPAAVPSAGVMLTAAAAAALAACFARRVSLSSSRAATSRFAACRRSGRGGRNARGTGVGPCHELAAVPCAGVVSTVAAAAALADRAVCRVSLSSSCAAAASLAACRRPGRGGRNAVGSGVGLCHELAAAVERPPLPFSSC